MDSRERINAIFNNRETDRIGVFDLFTQDTIQKWQKEGLPKNVDIYDYFDLDFRIFDFNKEVYFNNKIYSEIKFLLTSTPTRDGLLESFKLARQSKRFFCIGFIGPFEWVRVFKKDTFELLYDIKKKSNFVKELFEKFVDLVIDFYKLLEDEGYNFDGIWLWEDIGYKDGLLLSKNLYKDVVFPYHRKLCNYFSSLGLPIIFHSDGNILSIISLLVDIGVKAIHPLESYLEKKESELISKFSQDVIFFRNINLDNSIPNKKFIYCSPYPITSNISFKGYKQKLETIKKLRYVN